MVDLPELPMRLSNPAHGRIYGPHHLAGVENRVHQQALEQALTDGTGEFVPYADPRATPPGGGKPYGLLVNGPGMTAPGRGNNCSDASLAALSTFLGKPLVAAPVYDRFHSLPNPGMSQAFNARETRFFGDETHFDDGVRTMAEQYDALHNWITALGPGSAAYVGYSWKVFDPDTGAPITENGEFKLGGGHATVIVYPQGADGPVWWDPQSGVMSARPSQEVIDDTAVLSFVPIPSGRTITDAPLDIGESAPTPGQPLPIPTTAIPTPPRQLANLSTNRLFGPGHLAPVENIAHQHAVQNALADGNGGYLKHADPRTNSYGRLINGEGPKVRGRGNNRVDTALAAVSSFLGDPQVAAPRFPDLVNGTIDNRGGEASGLNRIFSWTNSLPTDFAAPGRSVADQFHAVHNWMKDLGPGSAAFVIVGNGQVDPQTGGFVNDVNGNPKTASRSLSVIVYPAGADGPVWWDPHGSVMTDGPSPTMVDRATRIEFIPIPVGHTVDTGNVVPVRPIPTAPQPQPQPPPRPQPQQPKRPASPIEQPDVKRTHFDPAQPATASTSQPSTSQPAPGRPSPRRQRRHHRRPVR